MKCILCKKMLKAKSKTGLCSFCGGRRLSELIKDKTIDITVKRILVSDNNTKANNGVENEN